MLSAYDDGTLAQLPVFDILADVRRRLGFRLSLAHLTEHTLGATKTADGLQSLAWIREGRWDLVEEYCRADVRLTERLFRHGLEAGWLRHPSREGLLMELRVDWDLERLASLPGRVAIQPQGRLPCPQPDPRWRPPPAQWGDMQA